MNARVPLASLLLVLSSAVAVPAVRAQPEPLAPGGDVVRYVVRAGDTCASIARRFFGDPMRYDIIHERNPSMGPPPHTLVAGTVLLLPQRPTATDAGPDARLTAARRRVEARAPADEGWRAAARGLGLDRGWRVSTAARSAAEITFRDASVAALRENTLVIILGPSSRPARTRTTEASLDRGELRARLGELAGLTLTTPSARATLARGDALVAVDAIGTTRVANHSGGDVVVATPDGRAPVRVRPGTGSTVRRGERPTPPRPLPHSPAWAVDPPALALGTLERGASLSGAWTPQPDAVKYRVEIARQADGHDVVAAIEVPASVTSFEVHGIADALYYTTISTIGRDWLESAPNDTRTSRVVSAALVPPGGSSAAAPLGDDGDPGIPPAPARVLRGTRVELPADVRCALVAGEVAGRSLAAWDLGTFPLRCVDVDGHAVPAFDLDVVALVVRFASGRVEPTLPRAFTTLVRLAISSRAPWPRALRARASEGVLVGALSQAGHATFVLPVTPSEAAADRISIELGVGEGDQRIALATIQARVAAAAPHEAPVPAPRRPESFVRAPGFSDAFGAVPLASSVGARDPEAGSGPWVAVAVSDRGTRTAARAVAGMQMRVFDEPLRLGLAVPLDVAGDPQEGQGALLATAAWDVVREPTAFAAIAFGVWLPVVQGAFGLDGARLVPGIDLGFRASRRFAARTRQAAMLDVRSRDTRLWASAYALDVEIVGPLGATAELDLSVGRAGARSVAAPALGAALTLHLDPLRVSLGARAGLGADARSLFGSWALLGAVSLGFGR